MCNELLSWKKVLYEETVFRSDTFQGGTFIIVWMASDSKTIQHDQLIRKKQYNGKETTSKTRAHLDWKG